MIVGARLLGDRVDRAAGGAAAREGSTRTLRDLNLLDCEAFARGHAGIAQAVDEHVASCLVPADDVAVTKGVAVLARTDGDARLVVENVAQVGLTRLVDLLLGQHGDRRRCLGERLYTPWVPRDTRFVWRALLRVRVGIGGIILDLKRIELDFIGLLFLGFLLRLRGHSQHGCGHAECDRRARSAQAQRLLDIGSACHLQ